MYISVNVLLKFTNITTQFTTQNHYTVYHTDLVILNTANLPRTAHSRVCIHYTTVNVLLKFTNITTQFTTQTWLYSILPTSHGLLIAGSAYSSHARAGDCAPAQYVFQSNIFYQYFLPQTCFHFFWAFWDYFWQYLRMMM